jgi:hypothetical protein
MADALRRPFPFFNTKLQVRYAILSKVWYTLKSTEKKIHVVHPF